MMTEYTGRTVTEAIEAGLQALGVQQEDVEVEVLEEGRGGVFGLGTKMARVRLSPRQDALAAQPVEVPEAPVEPVDAAPEAPMAGESPVVGGASAAPVSSDDQTAAAAPANAAPADLDSAASLELARDFLQRLLVRMEFEARVDAELHPATELDDEETYYLNIEGEDLGTLIGRRGETLDALQYLVRLVVNQRTHQWPHVEVDVEHYKQRRERSLMRLATSMADRAVSERRTMVLEAMPPRERRIIHLALRARTDVTTRSVGEGDNRKVTIMPA